MAVDRVLRMFSRTVLISKRSLQTFINVCDTEAKVKQKSVKHAYERLFPWKTLEEFVDDLQKNVVFNNQEVVAIDKPWGVGIHTPNITVNKKKSHLLLSEVISCSKYCVADVIDILADRLSLPELRITKSIDRHMSGVILLTTNNKAEAKVKKAFNRAISFKVPSSTYWCITKGYPIINGLVKERVGVTLVEVDEFGDHKEPLIKYNFSKKDVKERRVKPVYCEMNIKSLNKSLASAVVEISTTTNKYDFVRTYMSSKTSFILGDTRMAARVKEVLGVPIQISPYNVGYYDDYEPLPAALRDRLAVRSNSQIPIMIHRQKVTLPKYNRDGSDLLIETKQLPNYFSWTMQQLKLG